MANFVVSLVQTNVQDDISANISALEKYIREAAAQKAQLICLPENSFFMKAPGKTGYPDMSHAVEVCKKLTLELNVWILIGSTQIPAPGNKYFNRSVLINNNGESVAQYDKIHPFDVTLANGEVYKESDAIAPGRQTVIAKTPWGKLGMTVCYDLRFPYLYRALATEGADFISVPAAFTYTTGKAHWHTLLRARAIETGCFIFAPAQCGTHPGNRRTYGHSLVVAPWGEIIAEASEDKTGVTSVTIDVAKVAEARSMIPSLQHGREFAIKKHE